MTMSKHTPGPWGWFGSTRTYMYLATRDRGRQFIMGFKRKGLNGAEPTFRINSIMEPASELAIYEVSPEATSGKDPSVYRHDIVGFRSADARLIAAAPDHALICWAMCIGAGRWEPWGDGRGEFCMNGLRHTTQLDEFGCPVVTGTIREAITKAQGPTAASPSQPHSNERS